MLIGAETLRSEFDFWLERVVERPSSELNDLPICPYAKEARLKKQIQFLEVSSLEEMLLRLQETASSYSGDQIVVIAGDPANLPLKPLQQEIQRWREEHFKKDLWVMMDHPSESEACRSLCFNQGHMVLAFIQPLSVLVEKSQKLQELGYYKNWAKDYYDKVVGLRSDYYQKYLQLSSS